MSIFTISFSGIPLPALEQDHNELKNLRSKATSIFLTTNKNHAIFQLKRNPGHSSDYTLSKEFQLFTSIHCVIRLDLEVILLMSNMIRNASSYSSSSLLSIELARVNVMILVRMIHSHSIIIIIIIFKRIHLYVCGIEFPIEF